MNHRRIARTYLNWFQQEALDCAVSLPDGCSSIVWSATGTFVVGYTYSDLTQRTYQGFVREIANSRLGEKDGFRVLAAAIEMVQRVG